MIVIYRDMVTNDNEIKITCEHSDDHNNEYT